MPRVIWKGAISFGLVHVPVALYPASQETGIDFDWLDKRSMDPVGYKRVNKRTGKDIDKDNIVKGIKQDDGDYVILTDEQIGSAYPKSTQTIEIETFVKAPEIPFTLLEKPYYLTPLGRGDKVYALLREAMLEAGVIGVARVVMHTKERLAVLVPSGPALMLNTIRWATEVRDNAELHFPDEGQKGGGVKEGELKMAVQLISDMTGAWKHADYQDKFTPAIHALVNDKLEAGETERVQPLEDQPGEPTSNVVDLTALLKRSLDSRKSPGRGDADADKGADKGAGKGAGKGADKSADKPAAKAAANGDGKPAAKKSAATQAAASKTAGNAATKTAAKPARKRA